MSVKGQEVAPELLTGTAGELLFSKGFSGNSRAALIVRSLSPTRTEFKPLEAKSIGFQVYESTWD